MINSYSKIINISENSSLSKNSTENSNSNEKNLLSNENNNNNNNNNENLNEIDDFYIEKDFPINEEEENIEKPLNNNRQGNTIMFLFTKNLFPLICIGPHCKILLNYYYNYYYYFRAFCFMFKFFYKHYLFFILFFNIQRFKNLYSKNRNFYLLFIYFNLFNSFFN
jgi:hypothetical protein